MAELRRVPDTCCELFGIRHAGLQTAIGTACAQILRMFLAKRLNGDLAIMKRLCVMPPVSARLRKMPLNGTMKQWT